MENQEELKVSKIESGMVMPREMAEKEVNDFLEYKKLSKKSIAKLKESIDDLIDLVEEGLLVIDNESHTLKYKLRVSSIGELNGKQELTVPMRLEMSDWSLSMQKLNVNTPMDARFYEVAALTDITATSIKKLKDVDMAVLDKLSPFFRTT